MALLVPPANIAADKGSVALLLLACLLSFLPRALCITIYSSALPAPLPLTSFYASVGKAPDSSFNASGVLIEAGEIGQDCTLNTGNATLNNSILFLQPSIATRDIFYKCVTDVRANALAASLSAQKYGAVGLVVWTTETAFNGRVLGFSDLVHIPVLVISQSAMNLLFANFSRVPFEVELAAVTDPENDQLTAMLNGYLVWIYLNVAMFAILMVLLGYMLYVDLLLYYKIHKPISQGFPIKVASFVPSFFLLLWCAVDPFGLKMNNRWPSHFFIGFGEAMTVAEYGVILMLWVRAVHLSMRGSFFRSDFAVSIVLYGGGAVELINGFIFGILFYSNATVLAFTIIGGFYLLLCACGFILYGRQIVKVTCTSGNQGAMATQVSTKTTIFMIAYISMSVPVFVMGIYFPLGDLFGGIFDVFICALSLSFTFLILFFRKVETAMPPRNAVVEPGKMRPEWSISMIKLYRGDNMTSSSGSSSHLV